MTSNFLLGKSNREDFSSRAVEISDYWVFNVIRDMKKKGRYAEDVGCLGFQGWFEQFWTITRSDSSHGSEWSRTMDLRKVDDERIWL